MVFTAPHENFVRSGDTFMPNRVMPDIVGFPCEFVVCIGPFGRVSGRKNTKLSTMTGKTHPVDSLHRRLNGSFYKTVLRETHVGGGMS